jgi:hypothetical protein
MKQNNLLECGMRFLPAKGEAAVSGPAVTPATGLIRQSQQIVASNAAAASKAAEKLKAAAPGLLGDYRTHTITRVNQNLTYKNTAYLDTPYNLYLYMEISDRFRIHMTVHGFWLTVYTRRLYGLNRIWIVFASGVGFDSQQQQSFLLFLVNFLFSRLFLLSSSFASLFY